jgi:hypothetical protein
MEYNTIVSLCMSIQIVYTFFGTLCILNDGIDLYLQYCYVAILFIRAYLTLSCKYNAI